MNVFEAVRTHISARRAAEFLGLNILPSGMACCPFHPDRHPSMKLDKRFYCFGCHASGDAIDLVSRYLNIGKWEAAVRLAEGFQLKYEKRHRCPPDTGVKEKTRQAFRHWKGHALKILRDYDLMLQRDRERYAPEKPDDPWHPRFLRALNRRDLPLYLMNVLESGALESQINIYLNYNEVIKDCERELEQYRRENHAGADGESSAG